MVPVKVYCTSYCGFCVAAKNLLRRRDVAFEEVDVTHDAEKRQWLIDNAHGRRTVPVIFIGDEAIGGYQELAALDKSGELAKKLNT